jgi:hypothetical protein
MVLHPRPGHWTELCPSDYSICAGGRSPRSVCSPSVPPVEGNRRV